MPIMTVLLAATLLQGADATETQGLPSLPNGHYVERQADGRSACGDASAHSFDLDVRVTPNNPGGIDGDAGNLAFAIGTEPVHYQLTYALSFAEPAPEFDMGTMNMIDGTITPADGSGPYTLRTSILGNANGDAVLLSATVSDGGPPIILVRTIQMPSIHGALANGIELQPFERCPADAS